MKHHATVKKLGRERNQRKALMRSLAINLIRIEKIQTTEAKAKSLRPFIERLITLAKKGDLASRRQVASRLGGRSEEEVKKMFSDITPRYTDRPGGYTRITKMPPRRSDAAAMAYIEFV